jgi:hypothetical protein
MFRNNGGDFFEDVTASGGVGHLQKGHGVAFGDLDNDGDQDIYAVIGGAYSGDVFTNVLFENPGHGNHWLTLQLRGVQSNRAGFGARIEVITQTATTRRIIHSQTGSGASFGASTLQQEIGLGNAEAIEELVIRWPSGVVQNFTNVAMDQKYIVEEDAADLRLADMRKISLRRSKEKIHPH